MEPALPSPGQGGPVVFAHQSKSTNSYDFNEYQSMDGLVLLLSHHLPPSSPRHLVGLGELLHSIQLTHIVESLYTTFPPEWLDTLLNCCPNLEYLGCSGAAYLDNAAVRRVRLKTPHNHLHSLDVSSTDNLRADGLVRLVGLFPSLRELNASKCWNGLTDYSLSVIVTYCSELTHLTISNATITDNGIMQAFSNGSYDGKGLGSKGSMMRLQHLEMSECCRLSENGFIFLAQQNLPSLTSLIVNACPFFSSQSLMSFAQWRPLTKLEMVGCKALQSIPPEAILYTFQQYGYLLKHLAISMPMIEHVPPADLVDYFLHLPALEELFILDIESERHSTEFIYTLGVMISRAPAYHSSPAVQSPAFVLPSVESSAPPTYSLRRIELQRKTNDADYISDAYYAQVDGHKIGGWDEAFLQEFRRSTGGSIEISLRAQ